MTGTEPGGPTERTTATLLRSSAVVSVGTAISRVTGLLRTVVLAAVLGDAIVADAYNIANTAPNVVYDLILGGVLAATLVPVLVARLSHDDEDAVTAVSTVLTLVLGALTVVAVLGAPLIIRIYTWSLDPVARAEQEALAVPLLRLFLPQVFFYGLTALVTALLHARRRFALAAFAPIVNNVVVIGVLVWFRQAVAGDLTVEGITGDTALLWLLGAGTTAGIVAMALVLWPGVRAAGIPIRWNPDVRNPAVRQILTLSGWTIAYVITNQAGLSVLLALANGSGDGDGSATAWFYAYQFFQLPYGLFAVAVMTTFLPELAAAYERGDAAAYRERFVQGVRLILVVVLPSAVLLGVLALPLVTVLFERGAFGGAGVELTAGALVAFAAGLPGFSAYLYVMRGFYARQDTRTPFWINLAQTALTIALAVPLVAAFDLVGVASAFSAAYTIGGVAALAVLRARVGGLASGRAAGALVRSLVATAAMAAVVAAVALAIDADGFAASLVELALAGVLGLGTYLGVLWASRSDDLAMVRERLRGRRR